MKENILIFNNWVAAWQDPSTREALRNRLKLKKESNLDTS